MSWVSRVVLLGLAGSAATACGSDSTGTDLPDVVGTWQATRLEFVSVANSATRSEVIAQGASAVLVLSSNHTFSLTSSSPGQGSDVSSGTYTETASTLTITITNQSPTLIVTFDLALSGNTMTLTGGVGSFDFGSGEVPAYVNVTLTR